MNKKDATALIDSKNSIESLNKESTGLGQCDKLFVDQQLTPFMGNLAYQCRCLKRKNLILNTKVHNGTVKVLTHDLNGAMKWHIISHYDDLYELIPEFIPVV